MASRVEEAFGAGDIKAVAIAVHAGNQVVLGQNSLILPGAALADPT